ncbi:MAG: hypothetical protein MN733_32835 [Nitrososphaera sp.]|nr:hypothetical protein [Nitrososphaera sp.]
MQPEHKLHSLTITATLLLWYALVTKVLEAQYLAWLGTWLGAITAYVSTFGAYKTIHFLIARAVNSWKWLKKQVLGRCYVEGTWVGYYYGEDGHVRYIVDVFQQQIGRPLYIYGEGFTENNRLHERWFSTTAGFYNEGNNLIFAYDCEILKPPEKVDGISNFHIKTLEGNSSPTRITGSATDSGSGHRLEVNEEKVSDETIEVAQALLEAKNMHARIIKQLERSVEPS